LIVLNDDLVWKTTLGLIRLYRAGVAGIVASLVEDRDIASAFEDGRLQRRGKIREFIDYRTEGEHLIAIFSNYRFEFNFLYPKAFSQYLVQRHIELNRKLQRLFPQYRNLPLAEGLAELERRNCIRMLNEVACLYELTEGSAEVQDELGRVDRSS
jgi:hypothetical protein